MTTALILAGAVAKGAFEAGVLEVLAERCKRISAVVATSAGALNGAVFAAGLRLGRQKLASQVLASLWREQAHWGRIFRPSLGGVLQGKGLGSVEPLVEIVTDALGRVSNDSGSAARENIRLKVVATRLNGELRDRAGVDATSYEHVFQFSNADFDDRRCHARIAWAASASAAFPFLFEPAEHDSLGQPGPFVDGGAVNNTPISYALEPVPSGPAASPDDGDAIEEVLVVSTSPRIQPKPESLRCLGLVGQALEIVINERLFRDLAQAEKVNQRLARVELVMEQQGLSTEARAALSQALGWRKLSILEIRPENALEGNSFKGLSKSELRDDYLRLGRERAKRALDGQPSPA